jgi:hypothetical protein
MRIRHQQKPEAKHELKEEKLLFHHYDFYVLAIVLTIIDIVDSPSTQFLFLLRKVLATTYYSFICELKV